tara:strand:+ start:487 stop:1008 length:522 start_codon:yes stop_codon:yes gene_type:complete
MPNQEKINIVEESTQKFKEASGIYFTRYTGMNVEQATEFRKLCRENNIQYTITKNTLTKIAVKNAGYEDIFDKILEGQIGTITATDDSIAPARVIKNFNKDNEDIMEVVGLFADGSLYGPEKYKELADLPTRDELIGKFASMLNQPMTQFAGVLNATMTKLAGVLGSLKEQKN